MFPVCPIKLVYLGAITDHVHAESKNAKSKGKKKPAV